MFAIVGLVCFAALMVWSLSDSSRAGVEAPSVDAPPNRRRQGRSQSASRLDAAAAQPTQRPRPHRRSICSRATMPDFMTTCTRACSTSNSSTSRTRKQLYEFGREHRDDARPQLLLAWDSMNREWDGFGVRITAWLTLPTERAKDDPRMLRDLIEIEPLRHGRVQGSARSIMREAYGAQAVPQLNAKIADLRSQVHIDRVARLERLRASA